MELDFRIVGHGWARCRISHGGRSVEMAVSHQQDALGDLIRTANQLRRATDAITFSWKVRGGEYRWSFKPVVSETQLLIERILWDDGDAVFDARLPTEEVVRAIAIAGTNVLSDIGVERYKERWVKHDFPLAELARITVR